MFIDRWMDQQNVIQPHNGILLSIKKEGNSDTCYNMDESWGPCANWNMPVSKRKKNLCVIPLVWGPQGRQCHSDMRVEWRFPGSGEGETGVSVDRASIREDGRVLETGGRRMHSVKYLMPVCTWGAHWTVCLKRLRWRIHTTRTLLQYFPHPSPRIFLKKKYRQTRKQSEKKLNKWLTLFITVQENFKALFSVFSKFPLIMLLKKAP